MLLITLVQKLRVRFWIGLNTAMFKLNKIRAHIKMLELQELKLSRYLTQEQAKDKPDDARIKDITRAHKRVTEQIDLWRGKLEAFETQAQQPREPSRPSVIDGPDRPLIG